jgi:hypothetical protein
MAERIIDLDCGVAMVVTDLHGAWPVYCRLRDHFLALRARGQADMLVFCGDLIHAEKPGDPDYSLGILLDVMRLQQELGRDHVVMLLGNHELPHIYGVTLAKGDVSYTPGFEAALAAMDADPKAPTRRADVIDFLMGLPFYARTKAGVLLTHAGAAPEAATVEAMERLLAVDHHSLLAETDAKLVAFGMSEARASIERITQTPYDSQVRHFLAVSGPNDPRYNDLLRGMIISHGSEEFELMWSALFSTNEYDSSVETYGFIVERFLQAVSKISPIEQRVLVAGHIAAPNGFRLIGTQQLRLATYAHARPRESGKFLLLNCEKRVNTAADLVNNLKYTSTV